MPEQPWWASLAGTVLLLGSTAHTLSLAPDLNAGINSWFFKCQLGRSHEIDRKSVQPLCFPNQACLQSGDALAGWVLWPVGLVVSGQQERTAPHVWFFNCLGSLLPRGVFAKLVLTRRCSDAPKHYKESVS